MTTIKNYCLVPMTVTETQTLLGPDFAKNFKIEMDQNMAPLRRYLAKGRPASMGKEIWEYAVADSIKGAKWCGAGNGIADVEISDGVVLDVKATQLSGSTTSEASMYQCLARTEEISDFFKAKDKHSLWNLFVQDWLKKVSTAKDYHLLSIVRDREFNCNVIGFKVASTTASYLDEDCEFSKKHSSLNIKSIVDPTYANTKVYRSKTRMEIRITKKIFEDPNYSYQIYKL